MSALAFRLVCVDCGTTHPGFELRYRCGCGGTLDVSHDLPALRGRVGFDLFDRRLASKEPADRSGVWRFRELILPLAEGEIVTKPEWDDPSTGRFARIHDPEGNPIELWEPPQG